jgi:hypothetical protein
MEVIDSGSFGPKETLVFSAILPAIAAFPKTPTEPAAPSTAQTAEPLAAAGETADTAGAQIPDTTKPAEWAADEIARMQEEGVVNLTDVRAAKAAEAIKPGRSIKRRRGGAGPCAASPATGAIRRGGLGRRTKARRPARVKPATTPSTSQVGWGKTVFKRVRPSARPGDPVPVDAPGTGPGERGVRSGSREDGQLPTRPRSKTSDSWVVTPKVSASDTREGTPKDKVRRVGVVTPKVSASDTREGTPKDKVRRVGSVLQLGNMKKNGGQMCGIDYHLSTY